MSDIEVIVLGSGIAGCLAAALLAQKGHQVYLVSVVEETKHHLPESWMIHYPKCMSSLGVEKSLSSSFSHHGVCTFCSHDGKNKVAISVDSDYEDFKPGDFVTVDRDKFDRVLLDKALELGVPFLKIDRISEIDIGDQGVQLNVQVDEEIVKLSARYIIDASGKSAFLANKCQLPVSKTKLDHRLCAFSHFIPNEMKLTSIQMVSINNGYIFCIPTASGRLSIGCVMEEECFDQPPSPELIFAKGISQSDYVSEIVEDSKQVLPFIPIVNEQRVCLEPISDNYCIIGDAALFMDPFYSSGIDFAFSSAELAVSTYEKKSYEDYRKFLKLWSETSQLNRYKQIDRSNWKSMIRLFSDPHQPHLIPIFLTQAFGQLIGKSFPLSHGMTLARETYEAKVS